MKILQVPALYINGKNTGAENMCYKLSSNLIQKKNVNIKFASGGNKEELVDSYKSNFFTLKKVNNKYLRKLFFDYYNPLNSLIFKKILKEYNPDIVHFHNLYGLSYNLIKVANDLGFRTVVSVHDYWPICYRSTMLNKKGEMCNEDCSKCGMFCSLHKKINFELLEKSYFVAPSKHMKSVLDNFGKFNNVSQIYNGIELEGSETSSYEKEIIFVGRIEYSKGISFVAPVLDEIAKTTNWKVTVLGEGPLKEELALKYKNINFVGFANPIEYYKRATILIAPFIWNDTLPYVVFEAMSYGLNVITTNLGGMPEQIDNGINGFIYKYNSIEKLKSLIFKYVENKVDYCSIGKNAQEKIKIFNWDNAVNQYYGLYKNIIERN